MIRNWPRLMEQVYDHLKPGGWCELASIYPVPTSDDGSMPPTSGFKTFCDRLMEAAALFGTPIVPNRYADHMRNSGFIAISENIFKIPSSPWPKDQRMKKIAALEMTNVIAGATAFGLRAFERVFGWSKVQTEVAAIEFKRDVKNRNYHQYWSVLTFPSCLCPDGGKMFCFDSQHRYPVGRRLPVQLNPAVQRTPPLL